MIIETPQNDIDCWYFQNTIVFTQNTFKNRKNNDHVYGKCKYEALI